MIAKPINLFKSCAELGLLFLIFFSFSCKSGKSTSSESEKNPSLDFNQKAEIEPDSLAIIRRIREKESEIQRYQASAKRDFDLLHTDLDLAFDWKRQAVIGKARLTLKPFFYPQKELVLDAKDFEMGAVYRVDGPEPVKLAYRYDEKQVTIYLPEKLTDKDTLVVELNYEAFPERNSGKGSEVITDTKGLYFIDPLDTIPGKPTMIWTQGETEHNSKWFPTIDKPNERATQLFKLTVPDTMVSVSNGLLVKQENLGNGLRKDYWELKLPHAPYLAAIAVGNFAKVESSWNNIPLGYFVEQGYEKGAAIVFQNTPEMIGFFGKKIGVSFPWPKYDQIVVRDFVSGAMENTTASIFMEEVRLNEREALDSEWDYIIAHELFHQWFGDYVTSESWANLTLNEAFANYSEYLWNEHKYGKDQAALKLVTEMEGYFSEAEDKQVNLIRFDYSDSEDMFDSHSYNKGGVILHMLRRHLGDEAFFAGLQEYLKRNAFQSVEVHDLRLAMERVSGEDLNWFFNQWFLDKGHPELLFEIDYTIPENILITAVQVQDLEESPLFQLPVEVSWYEEGQRKSKLFQMNRAFQQFALENEKPVDLVFIDEGKNLLARRVQEISSEDFAKQFQQSDLGVARYEALDSLISRTEEDLLLGILPLAIQDEFWSVREKSLGFLQSDSKWGELMPGLEDEIFELAENDPKNSVRSAAIDLLASWNPEKYLTAFQRWANHPSYLIAGSALMGILASDPETIDPGFVNGFSNENNFRIVLPVAEYYISKPVSGKGNWFFEKAGQLNNEGMYYFLGYFSEYFSRFPEEGKEKALDFLLSKMKSESKNFIRLGAFQALMGFADEKDVVRKVAEIAALEKDENLRNYYNYFLEAVEGEN